MAEFWIDAGRRAGCRNASSDAPSVLAQKDEDPVMPQVKRRVWIAACLAGLLMPAAASAARPTATEIVVKDMHCGSCAKKIAGRLYAVSGVARVSTNVQRNVAVVSSQRNKQPSAKAMWEAVEKAGFTPVKLSGPSGTFTKKPTQ
jgi:copper chaperone CopZ